MEGLTVDLIDAHAKMEAAVASLKKLKSEATVSKASGDATKMFYPGMYFADKEFEDKPQVCGGETSAKPVFTEKEAECASACLSDVGECVGYQRTGGLCFLLKTVKTLTYYTGCKKAPAEETVCKLKLEAFQGLNLTPDKSGKNKLALK